jgi:protein TonB
MKYLVALLMFLPLTIMFAQEGAIDPSVQPQTYPASIGDSIEGFPNVEVEPQFPGGIADLKRFLASNINYPQRALEEGLMGKCYTQFLVNEDGTITDLVVMRGVPNCPECDAEAIRVIKLMPKWIPGKVDGKTTKMKYSLPVVFYMQ